MTQSVLDKARVRHSFAAAAAGYDGVAALQRQVGLELLQLFPLQAEPGMALDLGSGTGFLSGQMLATGLVERLIAVDLALPMLDISRQKQPHLPIGYLCADAEQLPLLSGCVSQLYSNLALQWLDDLPQVFAELRRVLQPAGRLVFATFGPQTLQELKAAWASVDSAVHVNEFAAAASIRQSLERAGFASIAMHSVVHVCGYASVMALMQELKGLGAHNVNHGRSRKPTTRSQLRQMMQSYSLTQDEIVASYEIIFVEARA